MLYIQASQTCLLFCWLLSFLFLFFDRRPVAISKSAEAKKSLDPRHKILEEFEKISFQRPIPASSSCRRYLHRADNFAIAQLGKFLVVQGWDSDLLTRVTVVRLDRTQHRPVHIELGEHRIVMPLPFAINRLPFFLRQFVNLRRDTIMFSGPN